MKNDNLKSTFNAFLDHQILNSESQSLTGGDSPSHGMCVDTDKGDGEGYPSEGYVDDQGGGNVRQVGDWISNC